MRARTILIAGLLAAALAGCGGDDGDAAAQAKTPPLEAREQNEARLGGLVYRAPLFRQLNPRISPDDAFYDGPPADQGAGIYAAFVRVCNPSGPARAPTRRIYLEDAFGERFAPVEQPDNKVAYAPRPLEGGECLPDESSGSQAEGAVVAFRVPFDDVAERPLRLVIDAGGQVARVELDV